MLGAAEAGECCFLGLDEIRKRKSGEETLSSEQKMVETRGSKPNQSRKKKKKKNHPRKKKTRPQNSFSLSSFQKQQQVTTLQATRSKQKKAGAATTGEGASQPPSSSSTSAAIKEVDAVTATTTPTHLAAASSSSSAPFSSSSTSSAPPPLTIVAAGKKTGTFSDIAEIVAARGWAGLYAGLKPSLLGTAVSQGVFFYLYSALRDIAIGHATTRMIERASAGAAAKAKSRGATAAGVAAAASAAAIAAAQQPATTLSVPSSLLVAALAGCGNVLLTNPIWVVATRMQASARAPANPALAAEAKSLGLPKKRRRVTAVGVARELYNEGGLRALWRGVAPSLVMVSNPTFNYMFFEWISAKMVLAKSRRGSGGGLKTLPPPTATTKLGAGEVFVASALAKLGATLVTYPILLVKARLQSANAHTTADRRYVGTVDAIQRIYAADGVRGFFEGLSTKITQSILAAAILMMIKEEVSGATRRLLAPTPMVARKAGVVGARAGGR